MTSSSESAAGSGGTVSRGDTVFRARLEVEGGRDVVVFWSAKVRGCGPRFLLVEPPNCDGVLYAQGAFEGKGRIPVGSAAATRPEAAQRLRRALVAEEASLREAWGKEGAGRVRPLNNDDEEDDLRMLEAHLGDVERRLRVVDAELVAAGAAQ